SPLSSPEARLSRRESEMRKLFLNACSAVGLGVELIDKLPVDHVPQSADIVGSLVLILQIISVLPNIDARQRDHAHRYRIILIGRADDLEFSVAHGEPGPTAAELP